MTDARRIFHLLPDAKRPIGGASVVYSFVNVMREAGYDARVMQQRPAITYTYSDVDAPVTYTQEARRALAEKGSRRRRAAERARAVIQRWRGGEAPLAEVGEGDVVVVPEIYLDLIPSLFPGRAKVVISQNNYSHMRAVAQASRRGVDHGAALPHIATSELCRDTVRLTGARDAHLVPLHIDSDLFAYSEAKKPQIAYMPRKNGEDADLVTEILKLRGEIAGFALKPIHRMSRADVAMTLRESLIFLVFSEREGFGLPSAEAMASGCIVIGRTGHGGDEFFDDDSGVVVAPGDLNGFVAAVEAVIDEYRSDPARLDALRRRASRRIAETYTFDRMRAALLAAWRSILAGIDGGEEAAAGA